MSLFPRAQIAFEVLAQALVMKRRDDRRFDLIGGDALDEDIGSAVEEAEQILDHRDIANLYARGRPLSSIVVHTRPVGNRAKGY